MGQHKIIVQRELGDQERLLHNVHRFAGLIGVQVMHIEGALDPATVRAALNWLQNRHPLLRAHIKISGIGFSKAMPWTYLRRDFVIKGTQPIPLTIIEDVAPTDWQDQMQRQLNAPIKGNKMPRVRATLMRVRNQPQTNFLMLATDHAVADAEAANMMTCQILEFLGNPNKASPETVKKDLPPALEQRMPVKSNNKSAPYQPAIRIATPYSHPWNRQTRVVKGSMSVGQTKKIMATLLEKKTSLHGLLCASALKYLGEQNGRDELTLLSNVECRRMCVPSLPGTVFGCYIDIVRTKHKLDKPLWNLAQSIKFKLITTLARNQAGASQIKLPPLDFYRQEGWAAIKSAMRLDAITVTSADATDIKSDYGKVRLADLTLAVSLGTYGANYFLISMQREGALELNLCYMHPGAKDKEAKDLLAQIMADLNAV